MPLHHRSAAHAPHVGASSRRREAVRLFAVVLAVVALILTSSALNWVTEARAAEGPAAKKAVVVSGPVHGLTQRYKDYARAIADAAEAEGMQVVRLFHPKASPDRVEQHANGADLFVYVGHGNGWPSPYGPFQEETKNGLGLNPNDIDKATTSNVRYMGADWLREHIEFAPNAVVILSHLSYASGNASSGMPIPSRSVAVERVDNFANGFLGSGARVVWALGWQPGADVVEALHRDDATMDALFMTRYRKGVNPLNGWIGHDPGTYASARVPGATVRIDPDPSHGYLRGITGDLGFTTTEWRDPTALPEDTEPPVISAVSASQEAVTLATAETPLPVFTPNGDGLSDSMRVTYELSEDAFIEMRVKKDGRVVRRTSTWALEGPGSLTWNGRRDDGAYVGEGRFRIVLVPSDRAGNKGELAEVKVKVLNSLKDPRAVPALFHASDGDDLAPSATFKARVTRDAGVSLSIRDQGGTVVREVSDEISGADTFAFTWDGTDEAGEPARNGRYTARIRVTRPQGTYAHDVKVHMMSFKTWTRKRTLKRGDKTTLTVTSAEPLKGKPRVTVKQRGIAEYAIKRWKISQVGDTRFKVVIRTRSEGKKGDAKVRIEGTDTGGGTQAKIVQLKLR